ncbi:DUF4333 domain-containing protein [Nocardiopsis exhalans]|uniref:DUF4333 domain-containing protein n=1 Tax=Nocardiopsis exhalans TaxID=163604 RepID=A0ABY5D7Z1_9ACTN|nr:DUF4333 domain-containing protein [Nocardiopsis exhalans]USY19183.1 DUF4333 domain-containing protein [Nocardiopsis exhalans]
MRRVKRERIIVGAVLGALSMLVATGCSASISADDVAAESSAMLTQQIGQEPDDLTCEEDLPAEVGAEIRCEIEIEGETIGATATVTEVDGSDVQWDIKVDDTPADDTAAEDDAAEDSAAEAPAGGQDSSSAVASDGQVSNVEIINQSTPVLEAAGYSPDNFVCSDTHILAQVGAELGCQFLQDGDSYPITVTVTSVEGSTVHWDIQFDE